MTVVEGLRMTKKRQVWNDCSRRAQNDKKNGRFGMIVVEGLRVTKKATGLE